MALLEIGVMGYFCVASTTTTTTTTTTTITTTTLLVFVDGQNGAKSYPGKFYIHIENHQ